MLPLILGLVVIAMVLLALFGSGDSILGVEPAMFASLVSASAIGLLALGWGAQEYRGRVREALQAALGWALIFAGVVTVYAYRFELQDVANRVLSEVVPGYTVTARGGELTVARAGNGSFRLTGRVNGREARFIFDTGATQVVLTDATARAAGIDPASLDYAVPVSTANGRTTAARVRLDRVAIGPISETRVEALVARPGALTENLLGMSFLERLASYEVRDDRLILRGR